MTEERERGDREGQRKILKKNIDRLDKSCSPMSYITHNGRQ